MRRIDPLGSRKKPGIHQRWAPSGPSSSSSVGRKAVQPLGYPKGNEGNKNPKTIQMPSELIRKILLHFDPVGDKAILARCLRVSKRVFNLTAPRLYRHIVAPGSLSPRLNPLRPLPKGVKWYDPTLPILSSAYQRENLLLGAEIVTGSYVHRHLLQPVLQRLVEAKCLKVIVRDFRTEAEIPRQTDMPKDQCPAALETPLVPTIIWEGCPPWFLGDRICHFAAYEDPHEDLYPGQAIIKMHPWNDTEMRTTGGCCPVHGRNPLTMDSSLLLCPPYASITLIFCTSRPTEAWSQRSLTGDIRGAWDHHQTVPAWEPFLRSIVRFLSLRNCDLLIVNAGSIDRLSAAESAWDKDLIQKKFEDDLDRVMQQLKMAPSLMGTEPPIIQGRLRCLSMREYIDQEDWRAAFTPKEIEPWTPLSEEEDGEAGLNADQEVVQNE